MGHLWVRNYGVGNTLVRYWIDLASSNQFVTRFQRVNLPRPHEILFHALKIVKF